MGEYQAKHSRFSEEPCGKPHALWHFVRRPCPQRGRVLTSSILNQFQTGLLFQLLNEDIVDTEAEQQVLCKQDYCIMVSNHLN